MLDLKSKLLAAGLVTKDQVEKVEQEKQHRKASRGQKPASGHAKPVGQTDAEFEQKQRQKQVDLLKSLPKNDQYIMIRRWVERNRMDKETSVLSENVERFFFQKEDGSVSWLTLEKDIHQKVVDGEAGIIGYMSNHGFTHVVVPRDIAEDVAEAFPAWLRALKDHPSLMNNENVAPAS
jgi:hypothetical protein